MRSFELVEDKVYESDFFLDKIKYCDDMFDCKYYFSAFLSASRSITFALQSSMKDIVGFKEWYEAKQEILKNSNLAKKFVELRNESQKVGICRIASSSYYTDKKGRSRAKYYFADDHNFYSPRENPRKVILESVLSGKCFQHEEDDVATQCEEYLVMLISIVHECFTEFGNVIDPEKYYTLENIQNLGLAIKDIEEDLGFPRGYTDVAGFSSEKRMEVLRNDVPWSQIDDIFFKYLNKIRYE